MPREVEFIARTEGGAVVWDDPDGNPAKQHKMRVAKGAPPQNIDFKVKDKTGLNLRIDQNDPFHVWENEGCPPPGIATDQIEVVNCAADKIRIRNSNTGPERTLQYQINVVAKDGTAWPCDPIIINDGGGPGFI
jgi:hypothetical protein